MIKEQITGALNGSTVAGYYVKLMHQLKNSSAGEVLALDLAKVTTVDSTSVALLVSLTKFAKCHDCQLLIQHVPLVLQRLLVVTHLVNCLSIESCLS